MSVTKNLHWLIYILFTFSCARQSSPTGGPKDTIPPILIGSVPLHKQINVKPKSIELEFSEAITLNNPKEQLIIAPTVSDYEILPRRNKVVLTFENELEDSTTYTLNFREAVQDITEKNPVKNLKLAFSTGNYIDSLSVEGNVFTALQQQAAEDITVAIQEFNDTLSIFRHKAVFVTLSDKKGNFLIENLKPGAYTLHAFNDQNKNRIVDSKTELYGFIQDTIHLTVNTSNANIPLVKLDARPLKLTSTRPSNTYFNIRSSKNLRTAKLNSPDLANLYYTFGADQSNIQIYNTIGDRDSVLVKVLLTDSINNTIDTTLYAKFNQRDVTPEKFDFRLLSSSALADKGIFKATFSFTKPLLKLNFDSIFFTIDSAKSITFQQENIKFDTVFKILTIEKKVDKKLFEKPEIKKPIRNATVPKKTDSADSINRQQQSLKKEPVKQKKTAPSNQLYLGTAAFISIEQDSSKKLTQSITPQKLEDLGMILADVQENEQQQSNDPEPPPVVRNRKQPIKSKPGKTRDLSLKSKAKPRHFIVQVVNKEFEVIQSIRNKVNVTFEDLSPATYMLRIILDNNNNGIWDAGNYLRGEEPERIIYYQNEKNNREINLKANYEIGPLLISY